MTTIMVQTSQSAPLLALSERIGLRMPSTITGVASAATQAFIYDPDLSPTEQVTLDRLTRLLRAAVELTPEEWETLLPILLRGRAYMQNATPTGAETAASVKDLWRVVAVLLRD